MDPEYHAYISQFLEEESAHLSGERPASSACDDYTFEAAETAGELASRVVTILTLLNGLAEDIPPFDAFWEDSTEIARLDALYRPRFPDWFTERFAVQPATEPPEEVFMFWLSQFRLAERYAFYAGHAAQGHRLILFVETSEQPAPTHALLDMVVKCGGEPLFETPPVRRSGWFRRLLRFLRR